MTADPTACLPPASVQTLRQKIVASAHAIPEGIGQARFCQLGKCWAPLGEAWCQDFAWWTWLAAGVPGVGSYPSHGTRDFATFNPRGVSYDLSTAQPGDVVFWRWNDENNNELRHVAVVTRVLDGRIYLSHGNYTGGLVAQDEEYFGKHFAYLISPPGA